MRNPLLRAMLIFGGIVVLLVIAGRILVSTQGHASRATFGEGYVARLDIEGVITASDSQPGLFGGADASSVAICSDLYDIADDGGVKAVVLRVNSPGGSAAGSDEIYRAIRAVRDAKKPVVVSMGDIAASGGYYISSAADQIFANGATLTGSIGVIFELVNIEELGKKIGVHDVTLHAGEYKDIGSPWRAMKPEEKQILTGLLTDVHEQFIHAVDEGRTNLTEAQVRKLATGAVFTGSSAQKAGLVDAVGGLHEAEAKARQLAHLDADAPVERYDSGSFWDSLFATRLRLPATGLERLPGTGGGGLLAELSRGLYLSSTLRDLVIR